VSGEVASQFLGLPGMRKPEPCARSARARPGRGACFSQAEGAEKSLATVTESLPLRQEYLVSESPSA